MAKGAESKKIVTEKILQYFPGSFTYDKEIRIPLKEDGEDIQLKCVLTCAKTNVESGMEDAIPGEDNNNITITETTERTKVEMSQEEKDNVKKLMESLGL